MKHLENEKQLLSAEEINHIIDKLAYEINNNYIDAEFTAVVILKAGFVFAADLLRKVFNCSEVRFVTVQSYENNKSTQEVKCYAMEEIFVSGKNVLIIDTICDSGLTLSTVKTSIEGAKPKTIKTCVLLDKKECRKHHVRLDYVGMTCPNRSVYGYGLDYNQKFRNLNNIYYIEDVKEDTHGSTR